MVSCYVVLHLIDGKQTLSSIAAKYADAKAFLQTQPDGTYEVAKRIVMHRPEGGCIFFDKLKSKFTVDKGVLNYVYRESPTELEALASRRKPRPIRSSEDVQP